MNRSDLVNRRYEMSREVQAHGISLFVVGDPVGVRLDRLVRRLSRLATDQDPDTWTPVLHPAKALRWRLLMRPQPIAFNPRMVSLAQDTAAAARRARAFIGEEHEPLLDELVYCADEVAAVDSPVSEALAESVREVGPASCMVIAGTGTAAAELSAWLSSSAITVYSAAAAAKLVPEREVAYCIGPPVFFPASTVMSPPTPELTFLVPSWFSNHQLRRTEIGTRFPSASAVPVHVYVVGEQDVGDSAEPLPAASYVPVPDWGHPPPGGLGPTSDTAFARRVLLAGGWATWLDSDGDRIRILDPHQPAGSRIQSLPLNAVQPGTVLVLREDMAERRLLFDRAMDVLGHQRSVVAASQAQWKAALAARLQDLGDRTASELASLGIASPSRAQAWTSPLLARPQDDESFRLLLEWLDIPSAAAMAYANALRRARSTAVHALTRELEEAADQADMDLLLHEGHLRLEVPGAGSAIATRVIAVAPHETLVPHADLRRLLSDDTGRWLE